MYIDKCINMYVHINNFVYGICYQLTNKIRNLLSAIQLVTYIIYNLLNRPTDGATVSVRKSASQKELFFVCLCIKLPFSLRVSKKCFW
jgi:hypothetical protein